MAGSAGVAHDCPHDLPQDADDDHHPRVLPPPDVEHRGDDARTTLVLHSCTACGRHVWEKDGQTADRAELLDGVKTFLEQPRMPTPRRSSKRASS
jgi:hypothetical protein